MIVLFKLESHFYNFNIPSWETKDFFQKKSKKFSLEPTPKSDEI